MKPHIKPTSKQLALNSVLRRSSFYLQGQAHIGDTKHGKAYRDFGYPLSLDFYFYYSMYRRIGLARAAVCRPIDMCWLTPPEIKLNEDEKDDQFNSFAKSVRLWPKLKQIDTMQSVSHYAGLIMRIADGKPLSDPVDSVKVEDIKSLMPAWEGQLIAGSLDQDPLSERYGLPLEYTYQQTGVRQNSQRDGTDHFTVHHSRVLIWNEGAAGNTIYGESALEPIFNALMDWEKVRGAGSEGFWKKAAMRSVLQSLGDTGGQTPTPDELDSLTQVITEMQDNFDQVPYLGGMELKGLGDNGTISGVDKAAQIALEDVAAGRGWSAKGLIGAQTGVLAGDQDSGIDKQTAQSRRENYITLQLQDMLMWMSAHCSDFDDVERIVEWDDLMAPSDDMRLDLSKKMAQVNKDMMSEIFTPDEMRDIAGYEELEYSEDIEGGEELEEDIIDES